MKRTLLILLIALIGVMISACGKSDENQADAQLPAARVTVTCLTPEAVMPGQTFPVVWRFELADSWHLYWNGRNDSGFPPSVKLDLPADWRAGPVEWPAPERHLSAGDILDHVYHGQLLLLQELTVPAEADPGAVSIPVRVNWLVCRDECVPGQADLQLQVTVADEFRPGPQDELVTAAMRELPWTAPPEKVSFTWTDDSVTVAVPGAVALEFYPDHDCGLLTDLIADGVSRSDHLVLRLRPKDGQVGPLKGILRPQLTDGSYRHWIIDAHPGG
jgi:DsbC/DsbD-like thiol-disulfide interchange protein